MARRRRRSRRVQSYVPWSAVRGFYQGAGLRAPTKPAGWQPLQTHRTGTGGTAGPQIPLRPPPGTYDPALDAQERAAGRGYEDLQADTLLHGGRAETDYL